MNETGSVKQHVLTWTWIWRSYFWNTENRMDYTHTHRGHRETGAGYERGDLWCCQFDPIAVNCAWHGIFWRIHVAFLSFLFFPFEQIIPAHKHSCQWHQVRTSATGCRCTATGKETRLKTEDGGFMEDFGMEKGKKNNDQKSEGTNSPWNELLAYRFGV